MAFKKEPLKLSVLSTLLTCEINEKLGGAIAKQWWHAIEQSEGAIDIGGPVFKQWRNAKRNHARHAIDHNHSWDSIGIEEPIGPNE